MSGAFYLLFRAFKKRLEREQETLRISEVNFERQLSETSIQSEQQERVQIAMDLHDEVGALLTVVKINMLNAQNRLDQPERLVGLLIENAELIEITADTIRRISNRLSPPTLVKMGLDTTLTELVKTIQSTDKMTINYKSNLENIRFDLDSELNVYRIIIENINNILKYGQTEHVDLSIIYLHAYLTISIHYVGIGLTNIQVQQLLRQQNGSGLKSIQSRVNNFRGTLNYTVDTNDGADISIKIPIHEISN
jgi:signal transduction histidine kinase